LTPQGAMNRAPTRYYTEIAEDIEGTEKKDGQGVPCPYEVIQQ